MDIIYKESEYGEDFGVDIFIEDDLKRLMIYPTGGFDIAFLPNYKNDDRRTEKIVIEIDNSLDEYYYFNKLYEDMINSNIYEPSHLLFTDKEIEASLTKYKKLNEETKLAHIDVYNKLVNNKKVIIYNNLEEEKSANYLEMTKEIDKIILTFNNNKKDDIDYGIYVKEEGSNLAPYDNIIVRFYRNLEDNYRKKGKVKQLTK